MARQSKHLTPRSDIGLFYRTLEAQLTAQYLTEFFVFIRNFASPFDCRHILKTFWNHILPHPIKSLRLLSDRAYCYLWPVTFNKKDSIMANFISHFVSTLEKIKDSKDPVIPRREFSFPNYLGTQSSCVFKRAEEFIDASENFINAEKEMGSLADTVFYKTFGDQTARTRHTQEGRKLFRLLVGTIRDLLQRLEHHGWIKNPPTIDPYTWMTLPQEMPDSHDAFEAYTSYILCLEVALTLVARPEYLAYIKRCICSVDEDHYLIHVRHSSARDYGRKIVLNTIMWDPSYTTFTALFKNTLREHVFDINKTAGDSGLDISDVETQPGTPQASDQAQKSPGSPEGPFNNAAVATPKTPVYNHLPESPESPEIDETD